ncbi:hypothetical protein PROFUN_14392 [Planoprotostelium fungivorum]|uniref:Uncharacterized protein n=1 Tax=Planoprotostelium fungivorum TaxID=1890364 RepID=A0A2P6N0A0_9EUKA|nr:hypothetical protein PROFUN_14392 [Planoprotostelium fungivorum]
MPPKRKPQEPKEERGEKRPNIEEEVVKPEPKPREHAKEEEKEEDNAEREARIIEEEREEVNPREKRQDVNPREKRAERGNGRQPNERAEVTFVLDPKCKSTYREEAAERHKIGDEGHIRMYPLNQRVVQYWIQHPPFTSEAFPMAPKQDKAFSAPHYGSGIWKWRLPGTQNWHIHDTETIAIYEYNYRRGVRAFKVERGETRERSNGG